MPASKDQLRKLPASTETFLLVFFLSEVTIKEMEKGGVRLEEAEEGGKARK